MGAVYLLCLLVCSRLLLRSPWAVGELLTERDQQLPPSGGQSLRQEALRSYLQRLERLYSTGATGAGPSTNDNDSGDSPPAADKLLASADRGRYLVDARTRLELLISAYPLAFPAAGETPSLGLSACTSAACDAPLSGPPMSARRLDANSGISMDAEPQPDMRSDVGDVTLTEGRERTFEEGGRGALGDDNQLQGGNVGVESVPEVDTGWYPSDLDSEGEHPTDYNPGKRASLKNNFGRKQPKPYSGSTAMYRYQSQSHNKPNNQKAQMSKSRLNAAPNEVLRPNFGNQRYIFGSDDRGRVVGATTRKYPYTNVVRLSNGCTGTLVSPYHVLTAAHCLHTGDRFKAHPTSIKVYVPHSMGAKVYYGKTAKVSRKWHKISKMSNLHRAMFDYGILQLRTHVTGRRHYTPFDWRTSTWRRPIKFVAYPHDAPYMLESTCVVDYTAGSLLLNRCDSASGTSGSAALLKVKRLGLRIVGVVSAVVSNTLPGRHFNAITRLTLPKLWDVCDMIGPRLDKYACSDYMLRRRPAQRKSRYLYLSA